MGEFFSQVSSASPSQNINIFSELSLTNTDSIELLDVSNDDLIHDKRIYNALKSSNILN